jgi:hypothetical protein
MKRILFILLLTLFLIVIFLFLAYLTYFSLQKNSLVALSLPHLVCPVPKEYCAQGKIIKVKDQFVGIGYTIPADTPLFAVFSGGLRPGWVASSNGRKPLIMLENKEKKMEAVYQITGKDFTLYEVVTQGGKIAEAREGRIDQSGLNLIISIRHLDNKTNPIIPINVSDFFPL